MNRSFLLRLKKKPMAWSGLLLILFLYALALLSPWMVPYDPNAQNLYDRLQPPTLGHPLGTDDLGRDVLSRMMLGSRVSLSVGLLAVFISTVIGIFIGGLAGTLGGWVDQLLMRLVDVVICIPTMMLILMLIVFLGPSLFNVMVVIGITGWTDLARMVRAEVLTLRQREFVLASRALGAGEGKLMMRHLLPNALAPVFVSVTFSVAGAILMESGLSFLGLGA